MNPNERTEVTQTALLHGDEATEAAREAGVFKGRIFYVRREGQRAGRVIEVDSIAAFNPETGLVICFGNRIKRMSAKERRENKRFKSFVYWTTRHVYDFRLKDAEPTSTVQGEVIPGAGEVIDARSPEGYVFNEEDGGRWIAWCSRHETFVQCDTRGIAVDQLTTMEFCGMCVEGME